MKISLSLLDTERWFGGDMAATLDLARAADAAGIDQITVVDHVIMGEATEAYPYGKFLGRPDYPWLEPLVQLGAIAAITKRIRLSSGIVIAPLRPAALLAKQIATLDVLSRGRVEIGLGVGWQKEEYIACGVPWEGRFGHLVEQVRICRALWGGAPVSFQGAHARFDRLYSLPHPVQGAALPVWLGIAATERNFARIAAVADGWLPMESDPAQLAQDIARLRAAMQQAGRDPAALTIRPSIRVLRNADQRPDLEATLAQIPEYAAAGVTMLRVNPASFCRKVADFDALLVRLMAARGPTP